MLVEVTDRMQELTRELYGPLAEGGDRLLDDYSDDVLRALREILHRAAGIQLEQAERVTERVKARHTTRSKRGR